MGVAFEIRFKRTTLEQYDQVMELMGLTPGGPIPAHALFHWAAATDDGLLVVDVWESAFNKFAAEQIGPFTAQVGFEGPPEVTSYEVHNYLVTA